MAAPRIAIVGAGIAGLTCARALVAAGLSPVILDKSRGVGGRLATRRAEGGLQFDHGAPLIAATGAGFAEVLGEGVAAGALAVWPRSGGGGPRHVGLPGMSGFARHLARGLDIRAGVTVTSVAAEAGGWRVTAEGLSEVFDRLVLTLPAPQILRLLAPGHALAADLSAVRMAPCLTLMAAFPARGGEGWGRDLPEGLEMVVPDASKPGRSADPEAWVAHATAGLSQRHLEQDMPEVAGLLLPLLCDHIGRDPSEAMHAVAHRWRFALVERALGQPCLVDPSGGLHLGGDWCLGPTAEDAWSSGRAIAADILARIGRTAREG